MALSAEYMMCYKARATYMYDHQDFSSEGSSSYQWPSSPKTSIFMSDPKSSEGRMFDAVNGFKLSSQGKMIISQLIQ
jgi:hypothetical protein